MRFAVALLAVLLAATAAAGQGAWYEGFEAGQPSWREAGADVRYRVEQHVRVQGQARTGQGCEWIRVAAEGSTGGAGTCLYFAHEIGRPRVIDELLPTVWVRSDRSGLQFIAEIVLPRTSDPRTGRPISTRVYGSTYNSPGHWQQLRISDIPQLLARQVRVMRSQLGPNVDSSEAYLQNVVLNVYGGAGVTNVWIDDLDVSGFVSLPPAEGPSPWTNAQTVSVGAGMNPRPTLPATARVRLAGSVLQLADGRPVFPRLIEYRGEPLALLKQLGFNGIWLRQSPPPQLLQDADRLGLWIVCPPPRPVVRLDGAGDAPAPLPEIGPEFQPVLAWDLGSGLMGEQQEAVARWAQQVRTADARGHRPLVCSPRSDLRDYSRSVDFLVVDRRPLGTSLELSDYGEWVERQPLLARPGTPVWTTVQTQLAESLRQQLAALVPATVPPSAVAEEQVRLLVHTAISSGSRGLVFLSQSPLSAPDPETRGRALTLEAINLELDLIEAWAAGGSFVTRADTSEPHVTGTVLRSDRARLVVPAWFAPGGQCVASQSLKPELALVVPGVPESAKAYELTAGRLQPLWPKRVAGGTRITLDEFGLTGLVLFAQDPLVIDAMTRRAASVGKRGAELERALAAQKLTTVSRIAEQIGRRAPPGVNLTERLDAARKNLQQCDGELRAGQYPAASLSARRAMRPLRVLERVYWELALKGFPSTVASPGTASFVTLPYHENLKTRLMSARLEQNRLPGGDFETPETMFRSGWLHRQHPIEGIRTAADLVSEAAHSGRLGLRLTARADDPENPPAMIETPPVWINSPAVPVEAGQVVCIRGWVNIPAAITGSKDGLLVTDSLAGEDLADRIGKTSGWREFFLYRVALQTGVMHVTFALSGLGEARLDDVTIQVLQSPPPRVTPLPPVSPVAGRW